jgi:hypothetical protein
MFGWLGLPFAIFLLFAWHILQPRKWRHHFPLKVSKLSDYMQSHPRKEYNQLVG